MHAPARRSACARSRAEVRGAQLAAHERVRVCVSARARVDELESRRKHLHECGRQRRGAQPAPNAVARACAPGNAMSYAYCVSGRLQSLRCVSSRRLLSPERDDTSPPSYLCLDMALPLEKNSPRIDQGITSSSSLGGPVIQGSVANIIWGTPYFYSASGLVRCRARSDSEPARCKKTSDLVGSYSIIIITGTSKKRRFHF